VRNISRRSQHSKIISCKLGAISNISYGKVGFSFSFSFSSEWKHKWILFKCLRLSLGCPNLNPEMCFWLSNRLSRMEMA
jgi:hypothetical protein